MPPKAAKRNSRISANMIVSNAGIAFYKTKNYHAINDYLRSRREPMPPTTTDDLQYYIGLICGCMKDNIPYPVLYRGTDFREFGMLRDDFKKLKDKEGKDFKWAAFTSASFDRRCAERFEKGILMILETSPDVLFDDLTKYSNLKNQRTEKEILLHKDTHYKINRVYRSQNASGLKKYIVIEASLLTSDVDTTIHYE